MLTPTYWLLFRCRVLLLLAITFLTLGAVHPTHAQTGLAPWPTDWQADSSFLDVWSRVDGPVASGLASRSWLWGPQPFAVANEPYAESSTGKRLVQYFDKARMEINDPVAQRSTPWFVTTGLLVYEMVTGKAQVGHNSFETLGAAVLPIAGDADSPDTPTYATFAGLLLPAGDNTGKIDNRHLSKTGMVTERTLELDAGLLANVSYDTSSKHNMPGVFVDWLTQSGTVLEGGHPTQGHLVDPLFVLGHPITEAYWVDTLIGGKPATVLVQLFERRALTYNPANQANWRVEMANVGRAYFSWRYGGVAPGPAISAQVAVEYVAVRGWNWLPSTHIQVQIDPQASPGVGGPLSGPVDVQADPSGRFALSLPLDGALEGVLSSGAKLQIKAESDTGSTALPFAGKPLERAIHLEGTVTFVQTSPEGTRLVVATLDGRQVPITLTMATTIQSSEGDPTSIGTLDAGVAVSVDASTAQHVNMASSVRLLSVSRTGAQIAYRWGTDRTSLTVTGTGWPGESAVAFASGGLRDTQTAFATLKADSRGNLHGLIQPPAGLADQTASWLFATASAKSLIMAQVSIPAASLGRPGTPAAKELSITVAMGAQGGIVGPYCETGICNPSAGMTLPIEALRVKAGAVLGLRTQISADRSLAPTATYLSAQIYPVGAWSPAGDKTYFAPTGAPVHETGDLPGRPFSIVLPSNLAPGRYATIVSVQWPAAAGGQDSGTYGFLIDVY